MAARPVLGHATAALQAAAAAGRPAEAAVAAHSAAAAVAAGQPVGQEDLRVAGRVVHRSEAVEAVAPEGQEGHRLQVRQTVAAVRRAADRAVRQAVDPAVLPAVLRAVLVHQSVVVGQAARRVVDQAARQRVVAQAEPAGRESRRGRYHRPRAAPEAELARCPPWTSRRLYPSSRHC